jgi:Recombinase/Recombinase zinc beta ribbon domain
MFERFAETPSPARLREELHRRGWYSRSKRPWSKSALDQILRNPIYSGYIRFNEQLYKGEHAAIVDENLFQKVQSVRRDRSHGSTKLNRVFLLKGLIRCAECGSRMTPHYTQKFGMRDSNTEVLHRTLQDFRLAFTRLTPTEQSEALQCVLKGVTVHPGQLDLEIFELGEFCPSSQKRKEWLPGLDSN